MLGNRKLILDTFCEVYDLLLPWMDGDFFDFSKHNVVPGAVYLIGRAQMNHNRDLIRNLVETDTISVILSNPHEGSQTLASHCERIHRCADLIKQQRMLLISGGDMDESWPYLLYDSFLPKILEYEENLQAITRTQEIFTKTEKPYKFLFLNGRTRTQRKYLMERFRISGLLDQSLWSWLDTTVGLSNDIRLIHNGEDLIGRPHEIQFLPQQYEFKDYRDRIGNLSTLDNFVKYDLFNQTWGEIYIEPEPYIDTYFSVVTETVFDYPHSFRTEKIWKPIAMAHPWIAASNFGYYRDMHNLGFQTFGHLIDESFDLLENNQSRISRIADVVEDLCRQNLSEFLLAAEDTCKYNQQHLEHMRIQVRKEFPEQFFQFLKKYNFYE
jgi:hypothetical protein